MKRTNYSTDDIGVTTFVVILDDVASAFLDQQGISDVNDYLNGLLCAEKARRESKPQGRGESGQNMRELLESTPDTSGYPQITENFGDAGTTPTRTTH